MGIPRPLRGLGMTQRERLRGCRVPPPMSFCLPRPPLKNTRTDRPGSEARRASEESPMRVALRLHPGRSGGSSAASSLNETSFPCTLTLVERRSTAQMKLGPLLPGSEAGRSRIHSMRGTGLSPINGAVSCAGAGAASVDWVCRGSSPCNSPRRNDRRRALPRHPRRALHAHSDSRRSALPPVAHS